MKNGRCQGDGEISPTKSKALRAVSLFAGAGGLDLGIEEAGYSICYAVEHDSVAVETLNRNRRSWFPSLQEVRPLDITKLDPHQVMDEIGVVRGEIDLLVGGPPCVAFSKSGFHLEYKRLGNDPQASLLDDYLRFLDAMRPAAFMMENVFGLAYRNQSAPFLEKLRSGITHLGYSFSYEVLNSADYGVPQNRQRLFLLGSRNGNPLGHPLPTHWGEHERRKPPANVSALLPHVTTRQAFKGLRTKAEPGEEVNGKYGYLLPAIPPGGNYLFYTDHEGHPEPLFQWRSRYWTFLLKLDPKRPSPTLQAQPGPYVGPFHWQNRRLRVPELKRLHTFPDEYEFAGTRREIQVQIGNAVPPLIGKIVGEAVRDQLMGVFLDNVAKPVPTVS